MAIDAALGAAAPATRAAAGGKADVWAGERPFDPAAPPPLAHREDGAMCGKCGELAPGTTPRGTFARCPEHGRQPDVRTAETGRAVLDRMAAAARRERERASARQEAPPRTAAEQLDIAEAIGVVRAAIAGTRAGLDDAPPWLAGRAAGMSARLGVLDTMAARCASASDPLAALAVLMPDLEREQRAADVVAGAIVAAIAEQEAEESRWEAQQSLLGQQERQAIEAPPEARRDVAAWLPVPSPAPPSLIGVITTARAMRRENGACELPHRFVRPAATRLIRMADNWQPGQHPAREIRACAGHDASQICAGYGFARYEEISLAARLPT